MSGYAGGIPLAEVVRSGFVEGFHHGSVAVLDAAGTLVASAGDPRGPIFPRSANKPMQAVAMLRSGLRLAEAADVAIVAASHDAEPYHVARVRALLRAGGLQEHDLQCPPDYPLSDAARTALLLDHGVPARVFMNCSGKHVGMLLTCLAAGWTLEDYLAPEHPLQKACRTAVEVLASEPVAAVGVDGCGAPVLAISLTGLARAFLTLVTAPDGAPERAVADAMRKHPELVSGTGREDALLMRGIGSLLSKVGAEGVIAVAAPGVGAVAMKIDDGGGRARLPVLAVALRRLGLDAPALDDLADSPVLGGGRQVGSIRALPQLLR